MSDHPTLTDADVWRLSTEGVNANELAAYAGIPIDIARAWISRAAAKAARPATTYRWRAASLLAKGAR
jgi:hypothetical protein